MIEYHSIPAAGPVTAVAAFSVPPAVHIIITMARDTLGSELTVKRSVLVAGIAGNIAMFSGQRVIGVPVVIEADAFPAFLVMTVGTLRSVTPGMNIVETVTCITCSGLVLILLVSMTTVAGHLCMLAMQGKIRLVMIKTLTLPALFSMAVTALLAEITPVDVICLVAGRTTLFRHAVFFTLHVTCDAIRSRMRTLQRVVRQVMIERLPAELDNDRIATRVVFMTTLALPADLLAASVKTLVFLYIPVYILMAIQAKPVLATLAERAMAATAFALVLRVPLNKLPGHHQRFDSGRLHTLTIHQHQYGH